MMQRNHYQVLGVRGDAPQADIRAAFVRLTKRPHPDSAGSTGVLPQRLQDVQTAYRCLSVTGTRAAHDSVLAEIERAHFARGRAVQRRLNRYDRQHPRAQPKPYRNGRWRTIVLVALVALGVGALVSRRLIG